MYSLNKVCLIGNVGKDPEIRSMGNGLEVATFSLATSDVWKDKNSGERKEKTEWHRIVVFSSGLVNVIKQYVKKGTKLYIEGSLQTRKWADKDGKDNYTTEIVLQNFNSVLKMLTSNNNSNDSENSSNNYTPNVSPSDQSANEFVDEKIDDDIPF
jgi:single-strand DNA-binding protein